MSTLAALACWCAAHPAPLVAVGVWLSAIVHAHIAVGEMD